jgi:hypothetical protein
LTEIDFDGVGCPKMTDAGFPLLEITFAKDNKTFNRQLETKSQQKKTTDNLPGRQSSAPPLSA